MALDFRVLSLDLPAVRDRAQRVTATATFGGRVRTAQALLKGFEIGYTEADHHVWRNILGADLVRVSGNRVDVAVDYLFRDSSGNIDDRYSGKCEVLVVAEVQMVVLHVKVLTAPNIAIDTMVANMAQVYGGAGIGVQVASTENLDLPALNDVEVGECVRGQTTEEQNQLFANRNSVGVNEMVVYFVRSTIPAFAGCAAHPAGRPGAIVAQRASPWTMAHEMGHVLGLRHVAGEDCAAPGYEPTRLMTGCGTGRIVDLPPDLTVDEIATMVASPLTLDP